MDKETVIAFLDCLDEHGKLWKKNTKLRADIQSQSDLIRAQDRTMLSYESRIKILEAKLERAVKYIREEVHFQNQKPLNRKLQLLESLTQPKDSK